VDEIKELLHWILGGFVALLAWLGKRQINRIDAIEREFVSRRELSEHLNKQDEDRKERHQENQEILRRIHERVDALWDRK
jgi:hypothetical protein